VTGLALARGARGPVVVPVSHSRAPTAGKREKVAHDGADFSTDFAARQQRYPDGSLNLLFSRRRRMSGSTFRVCASCPARTRWRAGERRCRTCGSRSFTWFYIIDLGPDPTTGKRRQQKRGGFETQNEAEHALEIARRESVRRGRGAPPRLLLDSFLDEWLETRRMSVGAARLHNDRRYIEQHIRPRLGRVALGAIGPPMLNSLYADIRDHGRTRGTGPLAPATVLRAHTILHKAFADAVRWGYLDHNPADAADPPTQRATEAARRTSIRIWTPEQVTAFESIIAAESTQLYTLWLLVALTGLRRSEALGLRWTDVDLLRGRLAIRQVLTKVGARAEVKEAPKSSHGYRSLDIGPKLVAVLLARREEQARERATATEWEDNDLVLCHPSHGPRGVPPGRWWYPDHPTHAIAKLIESSRLPRIRPLQDLRHTHASILLASGEPPKVVQERLGHHSTAFTQDTYQHLLPGMGAAAARRFEDLILNTGVGNEGDEPERV
jgi:integrase